MTSIRTAIVCLALVLGATASAAAQGVVFLVRHAERADQAEGSAMMMATDPELSPAGLARAESLAVMLADAGITAIYSTQYKRTQQTAAPLAKALGLTVQTVNSKDLDGLAAKIKGEKGNVLVVGHSNSVPNTIRSLGVDADVAIAETEYDSLFIVMRGPGTPSVVRLHYR